MEVTPLIQTGYANQTAKAAQWPYLRSNSFGCFFLSGISTGHCTYDKTCAYVHGDQTTPGPKQTTVVSSLEYFSGLMLLAMKEERNPVPQRGPQQKKKGVLLAVWFYLEGTGDFFRKC